METTYRDFIPGVAMADAVKVVEKDKQYGASWKRRGGVGAFMMLARKWDRLEEQVKRHNYDIFAAIEAEKGNQTEETIVDTLRDLRRYGLLVESEMFATGVIPSVPGPAEKFVGPSRPVGNDDANDPEAREDIPHIERLRKNCVEATEGERYSRFHEYGKTLGYDMNLTKSDILWRLKNVNASRTALGRAALPEAEIIQIVDSLPRLTAQKV